MNNLVLLTTSKNSLNKTLLFALLIILNVHNIGAQANVGIGTLAPRYNLHIQSRLDTTLYVSNRGNFQGDGAISTTRLGIYNRIHQETAGSRIGIQTDVEFPYVIEGLSDTHIGHQINFIGECTGPLEINCNSSTLFGVKVNIPILASTGLQYGIYSDVPHANGYAGYFKGRSYFSDRIGIGTLPTSADQRVYITGTNYNRLMRIRMVGMPAGSTVHEGLLIHGAGYSSSFNYGAKVSLIASSGTTVGIYSELEGSNSGQMNGIKTYIFGNAGGSAITGVNTVIAAGTTSGTSYGILAANHNTSQNSYSGYFNGKATIVNGENTTYSSDGYLQMGFRTSTNLILDNNEILARNNSAPSSLYVQYSGGDLLLCSLRNGAVGIGTVSSAHIPTGYMLAVNGKGIFEELRVELKNAWPDYVFKENYSMLSIQDLKEFIHKKGHLPNIPSAKEIEDNGIMLGDMQTRMMEKIEELTLYIIDQESRILRLENELNN